MPAINLSGTDSMLKECRNTLVKQDIELNKLLDDIIVCISRKEMNALLASSRKLFADAETQSELMESMALRLSKPHEMEAWKTEAIERRKQFKTLNQEIKVAVAQRLSMLEKQQRSELLESAFSPSITATSGTRKFMKQDDLLQSNAHLTENLARIARNMAHEITQGDETIKTLATSSETLARASDEFQTMGSTIKQGGHLIDKYDRRQFTDKIIITLAFSFFFLVCGYIVNKRLFGGFNWIPFLIEFFFPTNEPDVPSISVKEL